LGTSGGPDGNTGDGAGIPYVFLVPKTVFPYSPGKGIQEQTVMLVGYARVSTMDQNPALQMDALRAAGCERIFTEKASGAHRDRPGLRAALDFLREGGTLVVWKLSRLARSIAQVIRTAAGLERRDIALRVLSRNIDTGTPEGRLFFHVTAAFDGFQRARTAAPA